MSDLKKTINPFKIMLRPSVGMLRRRRLKSAQERQKKIQRCGVVDLLAYAKKRQRLAEQD